MILFPGICYVLVTVNKIALACARKKELTLTPIYRKDISLIILNMTLCRHVEKYNLFQLNITNIIYYGSHGTVSGLFFLVLVCARDY